ncbi:YdbL family protein [Desulfomarina sp.]
MLKKITVLSFFLLLLAPFFLAPTPAGATSVKEVKARMIARIPAINRLKNRGIVGENNRGFLEYRSNSKEQKELINAENADRALVYRIIGKKQGASPDLVGRRRAKQIAGKGKTGQWFQKEDGSWYKK